MHIFTRQANGAGGGEFASRKAENGKRMPNADNYRIDCHPDGHSCRVRSHNLHDVRNDSRNWKTYRPAEKPGRKVLEDGSFFKPRALPKADDSAKEGNIQLEEKLEEVMTNSNDQSMVGIYWVVSIFKILNGLSVESKEVDGVAVAGCEGAIQIVSIYLKVFVRAM